MNRVASNPRLPFAAPRAPSSFPSFPSVPFLSFLLFLLVASPALAQSPPSADEKFLADLRQRRLFELAEKHCREKLADQKLPPIAQADFTVELIRTLAQHAVFAPPEQRDELWKQARTTAADFVRTHDKHPRLILVRVQDALTPLTQGELARQELEAGATSVGGIDSARAAIREAVRLLDAINRELTREIPLRRRVKPKEGELSGDELFSLQHQVLHQLARAQRNQALLYEPGSADRTSALIQAKETLTSALAQTTEDPALAAQLRLELAACQRLSHALDECRRELEALDRPGQPPDVRLAARAETIRLELDQHHLAEAQKIVEQGRLIDSQASPELDLAVLETCLAQLRAAAAAQDKAGIDMRQNAAAEQARLVTEEHGAYWGRRADQLLVRSVPRDAIGNADLLGRMADSLYLQEELDQALAAYDQGAAKADKSGDDETAFELAYKAALVQEQRKLHRDAAERFCALAVRLRRRPRASVAHLRGIWNAAQEARRDGDYEKEYAKLLVEQIDTWPASESAHQARLWQGRLYEGRKEWAKAVAAYTSVPAGSEHSGAAVAAAIGALRADLASRPAASQETKDAAQQGVNYLRRVILGPNNRTPDHWTDSQRAAVLAAAEIALDYLPADAGQAEELLTSALAQTADAPPEWTSSARAQLILALASQPAKRGQAQQMLEQIGKASPQQLFDLLQGLSTVANRSSADVRRELAPLELATSELLAAERDQLDKAAQLSLDRVTADALAAADRRDEAIKLYGKLAKDNPSHGGIQEAYADLLLASDQRESLALALSQWRIVAARSKPRTERWFKARYSIALAQRKLGDKASAAEVLKYLLETPPGLDGTAWKAKYEALLAECRR